MKGLALRGNEVSFGDLGIKALEPGWITAKQIEACRITLTRILKKDGKILIITPRKNYNYLFVIKKHFSELSKLSIIRKIYILLLTLLALPAFIIITISNIIISGREKNGGYSQYSKNDIYNLLDMTNFSDIVINQIVAGQEWFVSATK